MAIIPIYMHEYKISNGKKEGIIEITIIKVTNFKERETFITEQIHEWLDGSDIVQISHKILMEGYKQDE